ncbi:MAG: NAD-dependent epimerase/dehydratase family protein, partial [Burkholderiales bacterium]
ATLYGVGKLAIEGIGQRFEALHGLRVALARITAVYGPWERDTGLRDTLSPLWQIAGAAVRGEPVRLLRAGQRDWVHAATVARALVALLDRPALEHRVYNVAPGRLWHPALLCEALERVRGALDWAHVDRPEQSNIVLNDDLTRERQPLAAERMLTELLPGERIDVGQAAADYARWVAAHPDWFMPARTRP